MKYFKLLLSVIILGAVLAGLFGCSAPSEEETAETQTATVILGDIVLDITAAGNLALSLTEDLAIDLFFQEGTIAEVLVEEGDSVEEGQVLVRLDADEWDDEMSTLEDLVTAKERALTQAQISLKTAEQNLKNARDNMATKELAVLNAQISLDQAINTLAAGITAVDYQAAFAEWRKAETWYTYLTTTFVAEGIDADDYLLLREQAEERLTLARTAHDNVLAGYETRDTTIMKKQVEAAEKSLANAEEDLADVADDVALKELSLTLAQGNLQDAEKALADAEEDVVDAQDKSPVITAPFNGFVTQINVAGGDEVLTGTVAAQIADPNKFEADILVSEMDILQVQIGGNATIQADAISGVTFPATVTHISPTATIQSGVVNYAVKVELESMEAVEPAFGPPGGFGPPPEGFEFPFEFPEDFEFPEGGFGPPPEGWEPPEDWEMPEGGFGPPPEGWEFPEDFEFPDWSAFGEGFAEEGGLQMPALDLSNTQLRDGLTVTVSIIVAESRGTLLVPNAAVITEGTESYVQVVSASGEPVKRTVQTGLSDYQYTEITEGLNEGEEIFISSVTAVTDEEDEQPRMGLCGPR